MKSKFFNFISSILMTMGVLLIFSALALSVFNIYDERRASESIIELRDELLPQIPNYSKTIVIPNPENQKNNEKKDNDKEDNDKEDNDLHDLDPEAPLPKVELNYFDCIGIIRIPAFSSELPVISDWSYYNLNFAPCRFGGSPYSGNFIICAHNYSDHFGHIQELSEGDDIIFTDVEGNNFFYKVDYVDILQPTEIEEMTSEDYDLTLFTCTFTGQARVTVRCSRI